MKTRNSLVGNSSSSSFIVLGKRIGGWLLNLEAFKKARELVETTDAELWFDGEQWNGEGQDIFELDEEMLDAIEAGFDYAGSIFLVYKTLNNGDKIGEVDPEAQIFTWDISYQTTDGLLEFLEKYAA